MVSLPETSTFYSALLLAPTHWRNGLVAGITDDRKYIVTSPTVDYLPRPHFGNIVISLMPDGHFGLADPIHHPQIMEEDARHSWVAAIQKPAHRRSTIGIMWQPLNRATDFVVGTSSVGLGVAAPTFTHRVLGALARCSNAVHAFEARYRRQRELRWLYDTLMDAFDRLSFPGTFRDIARQWACVQRFWLYTMAWLDWFVGPMQSYPMPASEYLPLSPDHFIGCITTSAAVVARLAPLQVPVWFMRGPDEFTGNEILMTHDTFLSPVIRLTFDDATQLADNEAAFAGRLSLTCWAGQNHIEWINTQAVRYLDKEIRPVPQRALTAILDSTAGPSRTASSNATRYEPCELLFTLSQLLVRFHLQIRWIVPLTLRNLTLSSKHMALRLSRSRSRSYERSPKLHPHP